MKLHVPILAAVLATLHSREVVADSIFSAEATSNLTPVTQLAAIRATLTAPDECGNTKHVQITQVRKPLKRPVRILDAPRLRKSSARRVLKVEALDPAGRVLLTKHANLLIRNDDNFGAAIVLDGTPCSVAGRAACPKPAPEPTIRGITMVLRTGNDDLRGGDDNVTAIVQFKNGDSKSYFNINRGRRWADRCTARVDLTFDKAVKRSDVHSVRLITDSRGGMSGDNWNLDALLIQDERTGHSYYHRFGSPLIRFTGKQRELLATW